MRKPVTLAILIATWLLWSGIYEPRMVGLGVMSALLVLYLAYRMGFFERGIYSLHVLPTLPRFWVWLLVEIVKANLAVAAIVLNPRKSISPNVVTIRSGCGPIGQTLLANAITLTPGTVTLDVDDGCLRVHCLTRAAADELRAGEMIRRVAAVTAD